jgi:putative SOS response-associated peptidase YedK
VIKATGFLTCEPNAAVGAVDLNAMLVILTTAEDADVWMRAEWSEAAALHRPLPDDVLRIVDRGERRDGSDVHAAI